VVREDEGWRKVEGEEIKAADDGASY